MNLEDIMLSKPETERKKAPWSHLRVEPKKKKNVQYTEAESRMVTRGREVQETGRPWAKGKSCN